MIENITHMQQEHIQCAKALCERFMSQYHAERNNYMERLRALANHSFATFPGCDKTPPEMDARKLNNAVFRACLLGTQDYFLEEGLESSSKNILLQGFFPSFFLVDVLGDTKFYHKQWDEEDGLEHANFKPRLEKLISRNSFPTTYNEYVAHLHKIENMRENFRSENKNQDEEYGEGSGRQKDNVVRKYLWHLYNKVEIDFDSLEQEVGKNIKTKTQEVLKAMELVAGSEIDRISIVATNNNQELNLEKGVVATGSGLKQRLEELHQTEEQSNHSSPLYRLP